MPSLLSKALVVSGLLLSANASWLPIKGWLSQQLISQSWQETQQNQGQVKPWPWADTFPLAKLAIPRLKQQLVVLNGGDPTTLAFSAGAIAPFNDMTGHQPIVIAGHNDSHFSFLEDILMDDIISLTDKFGQNQLYIVEAINIIDASSGEMPLLADDTSLTLITCYPFNHAITNSNERYVITARKFS